jgi:hypothetical protein
MAHKGVITEAGKSGGQRFTFYLATTHDRMRFYCFEQPAEDGSTTHELIDALDRTRLLGAGNKETAKLWAKRLGLANYTYVRV